VRHSPLRQHETCQERAKRRANCALPSRGPVGPSWRRRGTKRDSVLPRRTIAPDECRQDVARALDVVDCNAGMRRDGGTTHQPGLSLRWPRVRWTNVKISAWSRCNLAPRIAVPSSSMTAQLCFCRAPPVWTSNATRTTPSRSKMSSSERATGTGALSWRARKPSSAPKNRTPTDPGGSLVPTGWFLATAEVERSTACSEDDMGLRFFRVVAGRLEYDPSLPKSPRSPLVKRNFRSTFERRPRRHEAPPNRRVQTRRWVCFP
jgi:hypothetical protein